jgi:membrane protein
MTIIRNCIGLIIGTFREWRASKPELIGASLAFYILFSLGPLLVITVWILGLFFGKRAAEGEIVYQIQAIVGQKPAAVMQYILAEAVSPPRRYIATIISVPLMLFGSTMIFFQLRNALHFIWEAPHTGRGGISTLIVDYLYAIPKVAIVGAAFLMLIVKSSIITILGEILRGQVTEAGYIVKIGDFLLTFGIVTLLFAFIYRFLPRVRIGKSDLWIGAAVTSLLMTLGQMVIGYYIRTTEVDTAYGAIGLFTVLLIWIFYSSQIFILGAVFTKVYSLKFGKMERSGIKEQKQ